MREAISERRQSLDIRPSSQSDSEIQIQMDILRSDEEIEKDANAFIFNRSRFSEIGSEDYQPQRRRSASPDIQRDDHSQSHEISDEERVDEEKSHRHASKDDPPPLPPLRKDVFLSSESISSNRFLSSNEVRLSDSDMIPPHSDTFLGSTSQIGPQVHSLFRI